MRKNKLSVDVDNKIYMQQQMLSDEKETDRW